MNPYLDLWIEQEKQKVEEERNNTLLREDFPLESAIYKQLVFSNEINLKILETINKTNMCVPFETFRFKNVPEEAIKVKAQNPISFETLDKLAKEGKEYEI